MATYELSPVLIEQCRLAESLDDLVSIVEQAFPEAHRGAITGIAENIARQIEIDSRKAKAIAGWPERCTVRVPAFEPRSD